MNRNTPSIVIAGFAKCGTTTLCERLSRSHEVCFSNPKEPNTYIEGAEVHKGLDKHSNENVYMPQEGNLYLAEGSVRYSMTHRYPQAAQRLFRASPNSTLIFVVRDPFKRALSHWRMLETHTDSLPDPENLLEHEWGFDALITCGQYRKHIEHFLEYFNENQILIYSFEDVTRYTDRVFHHLGEHLGASLTFADPYTNCSSNVTAAMRVKPNMLLNLVRSMSSLHRSLRMVLPEQFRSYIRIKLSGPPRTPETSDKLVEIIEKYCSDDYSWVKAHPRFYSASVTQ